MSEDSPRFQSVVRPALPEVDLLLANDFEAEKLTGRRLGRGPALDREQVFLAATDLLGQGVRERVVIHAPDGACAVARDGRRHWQPSVALPRELIAGAAGAGDALAAGFLHGWHEGEALAACLELGVCAAAASLRHPSCSDAVVPAAACLALGREHGFLTPGLARQ